MLKFSIGIIILAAGLIIVWHYEHKQDKTKVEEGADIIGWLMMIAGFILILLNFNDVTAYLRDTLKIG